MSASAYPLPLALSKPMALAGDLDSVLAASLGVDSTTYNPETQVRRRDITQRAFEVNFTVTQSNSVVGSNEEGSPVIMMDDSWNIDELEF